MIKESLKSIGIMLKYAKVPTIFSLVGLLVQSFMMPLSIYFTGNLVNSVGGFIEKTSSLTSVGIWAILLLISMLLSANLGIIGNIQYIQMQRALNNNMTGAVLGKFKRLDYACFEDKDVQDTLNRMGNAPQDKILNLFLNITGVISMTISIIGTAFIFTQVSIWFSLVFFVLLIPMLWCDYKSMNMMNTMFNNQTENLRRMWYYAGLLSNKASLFELKIFGAISFILDKWKHKAKNVLDERVKTTIKSQKYHFFSTILLISWSTFIMLSLIFSLVDNKISIGVFVAVVTSTGTILGLSENLSHSFSNVSQRFLQIKHYNTFMELPEINDLNNNDPIENPHIVFKNVCFTYPKTKKQILNNVSFEINLGEKVSLVGENGAGKSTIIKLLCKLYKPDSGHILINDIDINRLSHNQMRSVCSVVFQDFCNYSLTLRENVAFGNIKRINDDKALKLALKSGLWEESLNLDTNLGKIEEDGIDLSGGQWQRIAIARACVAESAFILLDEPTASLDPIAESKMYEAFQSVLKNRGCIMISHRLASAKLADKIIVIADGTVAECGSHADLMLQDELYKKMFISQSAWYLEGGESNE